MSKLDVIGINRYVTCVVTKVVKRPGELPGGTKVGKDSVHGPN